MFLIQKYTQYKAAQAEQSKRKVTEKELSQLNHKIDKLLTKLDEHEPEIASNQDEECVVCVNAKATMQTYPCGHRVICRKCFVKTIQMAVAQRLLPLRCVICRAKILRLKHSQGGPMPASASQYTLGQTQQWYHVPQSASLYSVTSNSSATSAVSSASSCSSASSYKTCASSLSSTSSLKKGRFGSGYSKNGYKPLRTSSTSPCRDPQQPGRSSLTMGMMAKKDNRVGPAPSPITPSQSTTSMPKGKLTLIQEFQREFRSGKEKSLVSSNKCSSGSSTGSTRIKCARHLVSAAKSSVEEAQEEMNGNKRGPPASNSCPSLLRQSTIGRSGTWSCSNSKTHDKDQTISSSKRKEERRNGETKMSVLSKSPSSSSHLMGHVQDVQKKK